MKKVDFFSTQLPQFNLNGNSKSKTQSGGLLTLVVFYIAFLFALTKLVYLYERQNPSINTYLRKGAFENYEKLSLKDANFMMAWTLESYFTIETLDDPRFIKWYAYMV